MRTTLPYDVNVKGELILGFNGMDKPENGDVLVYRNGKWRAASSGLLRGPAGEMGPPGIQGEPGPSGAGSGSSLTVNVSTAYDTIIPVVLISTTNTSPGRVVVSNSVPLTPVTMTARSTLSGNDPENVLTRGGDFWMTELDTGVDEWIQFDFAYPVLATGIYLVFALGRSGGFVVVQGSNNGTTWVDLHSVDAGQATTGPIGEQYLASFDNLVATYRYYRLNCGTSPYAMYYFIQLSGVQ